MVEWSAPTVTLRDEVVVALVEGEVISLDTTVVSVIPTVDASDVLELLEEISVEAMDTTDSVLEEVTWTPLVVSMTFGSSVAPDVAALVVGPPDELSVAMGVVPGEDEIADSLVVIKASLVVIAAVFSVENGVDSVSLVDVCDGG